MPLKKIFFLHFFGSKTFGVDALTLVAKVWQHISIPPMKILEKVIIILVRVVGIMTLVATK